MKKIITKIFLFIILSFPLFSYAESKQEEQGPKSYYNVNTEDVSRIQTKRNIYLKNLGEKDKNFYQVAHTGARGFYYTLLQIAWSLKNLFYIIATIFYFIIVIKLLFAQNTEEQVNKFKKGIIWITIGLIVMQLAYSYVVTLYAKDIDELLALDLIDNILNPLIGLMEVLASFFFVAIMIFTFYRMVTANGNEEEIKRAKMTILYAVLGFILLKLANVIITGVYGKLECEEESLAGFTTSIINCKGTASSGELAATFLQIINWMNGFIGIITISLIIYTGFVILTSGGNEEKLKKSKKTFIYIALGMLLLVINYLILTFFLVPETKI